MHQTTFEYRVCQAQLSRVTYVDGRWAGDLPSSDVDPQQALDSCPQVWDYLNRAGAEGWDLAGVTTRLHDNQAVDTLYLKRQRA